MWGMESGMQGKEKDRGGKKEKEGSGVETRMKDGEKEKVGDRKGSGRDEQK